MTVTSNEGLLFDIQNIPWISGETVRLAMMNAQNIDDEFSFDTQFSCPFGDYVTSIGGISPLSSEFWQLSINKDISQKGIDTATVEVNDEIQWVLTSYSR